MKKSCNTHFLSSRLSDFLHLFHFWKKISLRSHFNTSSYILMQKNFQPEENEIQHQGDLIQKQAEVKKKLCEGINTAKLSCSHNLINVSCLLQSQHRCSRKWLFPSHDNNNQLKNLSLCGYNIYLYTNN